MLRFLLRLFSVFLFSVVFVARFGFTDLLALEISSMDLVAQANVERQKRGLNVLTYNKKLERAALKKAENMFKEQYWAHYGPNNESPWQFILGAGYQYLYAGENLAKGFTSSQAVHDAWMASPTHRANILDPQFQEIGIAVVKGNLQGSDVYLVVQMFGSLNNKPATTDGKQPTLKIKSPQDGDILPDGVTDIRGEAKNVEQSISTYLNQSYLGSTVVRNDEFSLQAPLAAMQGEQIILTKSTGNDGEPLIDSVIVTIVSDSQEENSLLKCIHSKTTMNDLVITYGCDRKNTALSATIGSVRYTQSKNVQEVAIPLSSLPEQDTSVIITVTYDDGTTLAAIRKLSDLRQPLNNAASISGTVSIGSMNARQVVYILFGVALILLLFYSIELVKKGMLLTHRSELFAFALFFSILFISFNFGFVRV